MDTQDQTNGRVQSGTVYKADGVYLRWSAVRVSAPSNTGKSPVARLSRRGGARGIRLSGEELGEGDLPCSEMMAGVQPFLRHPGGAHGARGGIVSLRMPRPASRRGGTWSRPVSLR